MRPRTTVAALRPAAALAMAAAIIQAAFPGTAAAQETTLRDLVITGGFSSEGYQGNLPSVAVPVRDSTDFATAMVGEVGLRGTVERNLGAAAALSLSFDGGLRQFSARGFELKDYAPREWAGVAELELEVPLGEAAGVGASILVRGRDVEDRPPMPLFLQPGYRMVAGGLSGRAVDGAGHGWDLEMGGEWSDFLAPTYAPQIRLLDRRAASVEAGFRPGVGIPGSLRVHAGGEVARFPGQETFDADDPYRRDRALHAGMSWTWQGELLVQLEAEGRMNRSNSRRPEYDAGTVRGVVSASLPGDVAVTGYVALTTKRYRFPTEFARLIPGEEANSASQAYLGFGRALARNLDGTFRLGWTRAETEIGGQYFQRFGGSILLNFRPRW